jgi:geranylgeranyl reductase family protein
MPLRQMFASVIVVGAGPAGATAARTLALAGVPVRLIDRSPFPRNKPCGGGISMRALRRFAYLEEALQRIASIQLSRLRLEGPDGQSTVVVSDEPAALMIRRVEFDNLLVSLATEAGAQLMTGVDVVQVSMKEEGVELLTRDGRSLSAPVVIAADGVNSVVARRLGLNRGWPSHRVALDMMEETPRSRLRDLDPSTLWVAYGYRPERLTKSGNVGNHGQRNFDGTAEGYAYIFPKRDHVNIGVGYVLSYYRRAIDAAPYDLQRDFVDQLRARGVVAGESVRENFTPFLIPVGGPLRVPGRERVLLAGDAGGFVNAFTAEGIYYAMVSGELAARAVIDANGRREALVRGYSRACDREIGPELRDSVLIQRYLFSGRRRLASIIQNAHRRPGTTRKILEYAIGRRSYASLRVHLLTRFPELALRLIWERARGDGRLLRSPD